MADHPRNGTGALPRTGFRQTGFRRTGFRRVALATIATMLAVVVGLLGSSGSSQAAAPEPDSSPLFATHDMKQACTVRANLLKPSPSWQVSGSARIQWRYNIGNWAMVLDDARASHNQYPAFGFMPRGCIGKTVGQKRPDGTWAIPPGQDVPPADRMGRSQQPEFAACCNGFRPVEKVSGASIVGKATVKKDVNVSRLGLLRNAANFPVGNVFADEVVSVTNVYRSDDGPSRYWVLVRSDNAGGIWGYVERGKLDMP